MTIRDLGIDRQGYISARIEVPQDAQHIGGINLFGEWFGDYPQALALKVGYRMRQEIYDAT